MDRFGIRAEAADSVAEYLRYRAIVGDADGGVTFTEEQYKAFKASRGIVDDGPARAVGPARNSEAEDMAIYEQRYQARLKAEKARLKPGETRRPKVAVSLNAPPMHLLDLLAAEDDAGVAQRPPMPWDLPEDGAAAAYGAPAAPPLQPSPARREPTVSVGAQVDVLRQKGKVCNSGTVRFVGQTKFGDTSAMWVGVELDTADGKNDGSVEGVRYFDCAPSHGLFVRPNQVVAPWVE
mmetsp:Transcript_37434/g.98171  ORF Transcript_37434/g.98171 Transcript_37434/m.98171 type:complete len:236 (-) Transcript_37434:93-800(-)